MNNLINIYSRVRCYTLTDLIIKFHLQVLINAEMFTSLKKFLKSLQKIEPIVNSFSSTSKLERLSQFIRSSNLGLITTPNNFDLFLFTFLVFAIIILVVTYYLSSPRVKPSLLKLNYPEALSQTKNKPTSGYHIYIIITRSLYFCIRRLKTFNIKGIK